MSSRTEAAWFAIFGVSILSFVAFVLTLFMVNLNFNRHISGHLKRAADASTVEMAQSELQIALIGIETRGLTKGYTSLWYNTPAEDLEFWYNNIKASDKLLKNVDPKSSQLEQTNMLIKLRQVLLDKAEKGEIVTVPKGASRYPFNWVFTIWLWVTIIVFILSGAYSGIFGK
jgi:hypothetical protein